ncbi:MAG: hypothetical protein SGBAC_007073 [Bacillariaceae sp.]
MQNDVGDNDDELRLPDDFSQPSKSRTMFLMRLNMAAYPLCAEKLQHGHQCSFSEDTLKKVLENGQSLYGSNVKTFEDELKAVKDFESRNWDLLKRQKEQKKLLFRSRSIPEETAEFDIGVSAMEWEISNTTTILVFRGTFTHGDYANIEHWMMDYAIEKSTARMKEAWVEDAGLEWTKEMQDRSENHDDTWQKVALRAHQRFSEEKFPKELEDILALNASLEESLGKEAIDHNGLTLEDARETGYWKLTKHIVDQVYAEALARNQTLILTGHSQGGTRAQLSSMYLQKELGVQIPTVSFAATGAACMARLLFDTSANLLQDVDPFSGHDQIVEYVHPLDVWGNSMLGEDGTRTCYISSKPTLKITEANGTVEGNRIDSAYEYCSHVYGWPGPLLLANEHSPIADEEMRRDFQRCRYFTHNSVAIFLKLSYSLLENGATAISNTTTGTVGGCVEAKIIPRADPGGVCPTGNLTIREKEAFGLLLAVFLVTIFLSICLCYKCWMRNLQTRGYQAGLSPVTHHDESTVRESSEAASIELPELT